MKIVNGYKILDWRYSASELKELIKKYTKEYGDNIYFSAESSAGDDPVLVVRYKRVQTIREERAERKMLKQKLLEETNGI